jgi:hypothetical protein
VLPLRCSRTRAGELPALSSEVTAGANKTVIMKSSTEQSQTPMSPKLGLLRATLSEPGQPPSQSSILHREGEARTSTGPLTPIETIGT